MCRLNPRLFQNRERLNNVADGGLRPKAQTACVFGGQLSLGLRAKAALQIALGSFLSRRRERYRLKAIHSATAGCA